MTYSEMAALPPGREKAVEYLISALLTDGAHHKVWCVERALKALGVNLADLRRELAAEDYTWEPGIPP